MPRFEVYIPAAMQGEFNVTLRVEADNWMAALKTGMKKLGEHGSAVANIMVDIVEDTSIHVTDSATGRVFRIKELEEAVPGSSAPAPVPAPLAAAQQLAPIPIASSLPELAPAPAGSPFPRAAPAAAISLTAPAAPIPLTAPVEPIPLAPPAQPIPLRPDEPIPLVPVSQPIPLTAAAEPIPLRRPAPPSPLAPLAQPIPLTQATPKLETPAEAKKAPAPATPREAPAPAKASSTPAKSEASVSKDRRAPEPRPARAETADARRVEQLEKPAKPVTGPIGRTKTGVQLEDVFSDLFERTQDVYGMDRDAGLRFLLDLALEKIPAESGSVFVSDFDTSDIYLAIARGPKSDELMKMKLRLPAGVGIVGFCTQEAVGVALSDCERDPRFYRQVSEKIGYPTQSILCAPMVADGRSFGCIEIINKKGSSHFSDAEMSILNYVAHQGARYLERQA